MSDKLPPSPAEREFTEQNREDFGSLEKANNTVVNDPLLIKSIFLEEQALLDDEIVKLHQSRPSRLAPKQAQTEYLNRVAEVTGRYNEWSKISEKLFGIKPE